MPVSLRAYRSLLGTYLRPQWGLVALLTATLLGSLGLQLLNPQIIRRFIDTAQTHGAPATLQAAAVLFLAVGLAQQALSLATSYLSLQISWTATNALRADLARHCLALDLPFHKSHTPGELIERIDGDVTKLANFFTQFVVRLLGNGMLIAAVLVLLWREDWRGGLGLAVYSGIILGGLGAIQRFGQRRWAAARQATAAQYGFLEERIAGTEDIRGSGATAYTLYGLYGHLRTVLERSRAAWLANSLGFVISNFLYITGYGLGLALGAYLYTQGAVTIGTAFLIVYYIGMLAAPLESIRDQAQDLQQAAAGIARVRALLGQRPQVVEAPRGRLPAGALGVTFAGVSFGYDDGPAAPAHPTPASEDAALVLREVCVDLPPGRVLGVLGRTGSGKTTLTRLLFRLYDPTSGQIRLGGMDIRDLAFADLHGRVGLVTQDVQLFGASVRDNIAFFDAAVGDAAIRGALDALGLAEWVAAMPAGLETVLAPGGGGMSAGEAQLLAFTRVFLRNPGLVILDEAASRLDPATERRLEGAVDRLLAGRTGLIIAHHLRTVRRADDILILEGGCVVEYGPRARLAADPTSRFYRLLQTGLEEVLA
ncbi:MAG TPA: ABC transporter ATP-binding protein [Chloroflexia bacterium]|nr:ABC transporter ATP-binding protein [Chloroflexia bacterium]